MSEPDTAEPSPGQPAAYRDFIRERIDEERARGESARVATRFPPEPNGYLHIGHAKSICLNFGIAAEYGGTCNLRFDDTNPTKEAQEYIDAIEADVRWLGFDWQDRLFHASDDFEQMYLWAERLIEAGKAYVCDLSAGDIRAYRGTLTEPGRPSPYRNRPAAENLDLFRRMRAGEFPDGARVLRAKIDMASPNLNMRDPVLYRILHAAHPHAGDAWRIYPMYDYAHPLEDAIEKITHSICTLEFEDHRPLYDWCIEAIGIPEPRPRQIEFARLNLTHTVLSKRRLLKLVADRHVDGWDDPRMPTLSGLRRRGFTPAAIRAFCERIGVAKRDSLVDVTLLENAVRDDLNRSAPRAMAVLRPVRVVIENYPEGRTEEIEAVNNPEDPAAGTRKVPFSRTLWIEQDDFREVPPKKFHRLYPGNEIRLRYAYIVKCVGLTKDEKTGEVVEIRCTYDPATLGDSAPEGRRVKGTCHWVSAAHAADAEVRLYEHLFLHEAAGGAAAPGSGASAPGSSAAPGGPAAPGDAALRSTSAPGDAASTGDGRESPAGAEEEPPESEAASWLDDLNPASRTVLTGCKVEPALAAAEPGSRWQFERQGYFCADTKDSRPGRPVFHRTVTLRDTWAKIQKKTG